MFKDVFILFFVFGFLGGVLSLVNTEVCSPFGNDFYHEGIEYIPSKGLIVGRVGGDAMDENSITIVDTDGGLTPWTTTAPPDIQKYQLGLPVDMDRDWLVATNLNKAPEADGLAGVLVLRVSTGEKIFYWDGTQIASNFTPNDVTVCPNGKIYVTDHVHGNIVEIENENIWKKITQIEENHYERPLETEASLTNGIVCISNDILLVSLMTPKKVEGKTAVKGKLLRVHIEKRTYEEVPLPDVEGVGDYVRFDGIYKEDATSVWIATNSGNKRALKITATDNSWRKVKEIYASKPSACNNGPTTGVLVNGTFHMAGGNLASISASSMVKVWTDESGSGKTEKTSGKPKFSLEWYHILCFFILSSCCGGCWKEIKKEASRDSFVNPSYVPPEMDQPLLSGEETEGVQLPLFQEP